MSYLLNILVICEIYLILALAMDLMSGYSGLLSMAQAVFYGMGAYVTALLELRMHCSFPLALVGAVLFNMVSCIPVIWFSTRLRDLYFTLATLSLQIVIYSILYNWMAVTKGPAGIGGIPRPQLAGLSFSSGPAFSVFGGITTLTIVLFFLGLKKTPLFRLFQGVRDDQLAMMALGKKPTYYKAIAILISSGVSAIAGALFATYYSYIDPTSFGLDESILIISIVLIGGMGSIRGSLTGALVYVLLPEILRFAAIPDSIAANMRMVIYALTLILIVRFRPYGFFGKYRFE